MPNHFFMHPGELTPCLWRGTMILCLAVLAFAAQAQRQVVFMKKETVVARYQVGDYFRCKLKNGNYSEGRIIDLQEFTIITTTDTIPFAKLWKVRFRSKPVNVTSGIGGALLVGGPIYFGIDLFNTMVVNGSDGLSKNVVMASLAMSAVGAALIFIKPRYSKAWKYRVRTIDYMSPFYKFR